jgi:hypothetical protein
VIFGSAVKVIGFLEIGEHGIGNNLGALCANNDLELVRRTGIIELNYENRSSLHRKTQRLLTRPIKRSNHIIFHALCFLFRVLGAAAERESIKSALEKAAASSQLISMLQF